MSDWKQIQARIRKARTSSDAPAQLAELYERTRDAMVAFELAQWYEKAGDGPAAAQWYTSAAQRFRRAQWRTKAEEALTRLGAPIPVASIEADAPANPAESSGGPVSSSSEEIDALSVVESVQASGTGNGPAAVEVEGESILSSSPTAAVPEGDPLKRKRRRGRRGGRGRRGRGARPGGEAAGAGAVSAAPVSSRVSAPAAKQPVRPVAPQPVREEAEPEYIPRPAAEGTQQTAATPSWQSRTRAGEPALASRISQLESQLRRLLACSQVGVDDSDQAPAGPGVLVLSDSDQVTHYYVEACQTLRIGVGNLLRGGRGSDAGRLKERMAENLGIPESKVAKYLKEHCLVRWLQLDEGAKELAHFAISVLRPAVNE